MKITIAHLYPDLLNLYGDRGNIQCMKMRLIWRGYDAEVKEYNLGESIHFTKTDIVLLGGGSDREQMIVCRRLQEIRKDFKEYVEDGGVVIAVCGGYQLLGHEYSTPDGDMEGLHLVDLTTKQGSPRLISNIVLENPIFPYPVTGFENHGGRTILGEGVKPFGKVVCGYGNNGEDGFEGALYKNVVGTYLHGLFDTGRLTEALVAWLLERKGLPAETMAAESHAAYQERQFDLLADEVRKALDMEAVYRILDACE